MKNENDHTQTLGEQNGHTLGNSSDSELKK